jgi:hypothetical protein
MNGRTIALGVWAVLAVAVAAIGGPLAPIVVFSFALIAPGRAIVARVELDDLALEIGLTLAVSFSVVILVSLALLLVDVFTPLRALAVVGLVTVLFAIPSRREPAET